MTKKQSRATKQAHAQRAAERAAAIRAESERKERRRRTIVVTAVVVGVLTLVVAIATIVQSGRDTTGSRPPARGRGRHLRPAARLRRRTGHGGDLRGLHVPLLR